MTLALVTGIGGQDGGYLAEQLLGRGVEVHALVRGPGRPAHCPDAVVLHVGDLTETAAVRALLLQVRPDEVYNLAAVSSVARSWREPEAVRRINGEAAVALMASAYALMEAAGRPVRFVQASSAEIFGAPATAPQDESTPVSPTNPYGEAKAVAHGAVATWRARGLPAVSAILYGHESPRRPGHFVTRKITRGVADVVHGRADAVVLGNLDARRDWGWAPDHVDAMVRAAGHPTPQDYVVATGQSHTVRDLAAAAFAHAGIDDWERHVRVDASLVRPTDAADLRGDSARARRELGWRPTRSFTEVVGAMVDADLARPAG
ncbi:GDP-mannose 4,6-dehydratase [uncultured Nocardioides sp.]|uniref:GDP-mannose 4,6-dehydratase n=1 Tax=uncultured Nocardioides sp. TaxID=198441 RepID=A0A6J4NEX5_9ACTN|nr:GDP-mannose 4,6-dehydratase [uncultured Nocardioides sp.]CAA9380922.1 MAG: GDP-mannose 4,6-dehydratase [uncultured Nocardioides sp.]